MTGRVKQGPPGIIQRESGMLLWHISSRDCCLPIVRPRRHAHVCSREFDAATFSVTPQCHEGACNPTAMHTTLAGYV